MFVVKLIILSKSILIDEMDLKKIKYLLLYI